MPTHDFDDFVSGLLAAVKADEITATVIGYGRRRAEVSEQEEAKIHSEICRTAWDMMDEARRQKDPKEKRQTMKTALCLLDHAGLKKPADNITTIY